MLILVGVTINLVVNGGILEKAKIASEQTQIAVDKEMLSFAVIATTDSTGDIHLDRLVLPDGFTYNSTSKIYTSEFGNEFIINETTGEVLEVNESQQSGNSSSSSVEQNQWRQWGLTSDDIQFDVPYKIVSGIALNYFGQNAYVVLGSTGTYYDTWGDNFSTEQMTNKLQQQTFIILNDHTGLMITDGNNDNIYDNIGATVILDNYLTIYNIEVNYTIEQISNLSDTDIATIAQNLLIDDNILAIFEANYEIDRNYAYNLTFTDLSTLTAADWQTIEDNDMLTVFYPSIYSGGAEASANSDVSSLWFETEDGGILVYQIDGTLQSHENYNFMLGQGYWRHAGESDSIDDPDLPEYTSPITLSNVKIASAEEMEDFGFTAFTDELLRKIFIIEKVEN